MVNEKDPAMMPGEGARAIDTFRNDYSANGSIEQAEKALRRENFGNGFNDFGYFDEMACMMAYLALRMREDRKLQIKRLEKRLSFSQKTSVLFYFEFMKKRPFI